MAFKEAFPALKQGVRIVADVPGEPAMQLTGVVDAVSDKGGIKLRCLDEVKAAMLEGGTRVTLEYFRAGVVYRLTAPVVTVTPGTTEEGPESYPQVVIDEPDDLRKIQRRRYRRALVGVPVTYVPVDVPEGFESDSRKGRELLTQWARAIADSGYEASTETISGSGLRMRVDAPVKIGDTLFLQIELPDGPVRVVGEVVWVGSGFPLEAPGQALGLEFKTLSDDQVQAILDFVEGMPSV